MSPTASTTDDPVTTDHSRYDEYEDSGMGWLGEMPGHWKPMRLRFLLELSPSKNEVRDLPEDEEVSFVPMDEIGEEGGLDLEQAKELREVVDGYTYFREGDVLVAKITPCFENRKGALASDLENGIGFGTTELHVLRPDEVLDGRYLFYATMSHPFRKVGESTMYGAGGQKRVSDDFIRNLEWPIPPLDEQRTIATYLDRETKRIDALIERKEQLIDLLEEKRTSLISHVVTRGLDDDVEIQDSGVEWLGKIPTEWRLSRLKWCVRDDAPICYGIVQPGDHIDGGVPFVQTTNISTGTFDLEHLQRTSQEIASEYQRSKLEAGDVILGIRASIGAAYIVPKELDGANLSRGIARIAVSGGMRGKYLKYYLSGAHAQSYWSLAQQGATFNEVSIANVRELPVPVPPLSEQDEIANHLDRQISQVEALIRKVEGAIEQLKEYRTALISAAVTGQIDVREATGKPVGHQNS